MKTCSMALGLALAASSAVAESSFAPVAEGQVFLLLAGRSVDYDDASQFFAHSGETIYRRGDPSRGRWAERDGQYCSVWPPSDRWACYDLLVSDDGARLRFIGPAGDVTEGRFVE